MNNNWKKEEFLAYLLLYASHCNFFESKEEEKYILSVVNQETYLKIHNEVVADSDEDSLTKIQDYISHYYLSQPDRDGLIREIKKVFFADGYVDNMEKKVFKILQKIIG
ncbi:hypothetical protein DUT90_07135 [Polaribacter sp. WD7]|uniref:hypothetical protein n=1 Tax=Polaribacter sp. WD7 TaxID=2269061 RepID=UPI000DF2DA04|nr:hypothetical protein [Polaribacter sp. WD7]RCS26891.1 hypothetical protein DUT90_07135 [Polaribacter sp. WD7]